MNNSDGAPRDQSRPATETTDRVQMDGVAPAGAVRDAGATVAAEGADDLPAQRSVHPTRRISDKAIILIIGGVALGGILCMVIVVFALIAVRS